MRNLMMVSFCAVLALSFQGCATILNDATQPVAFSSDPQGAIVSVDGAPMGRTPCTLPIARKGWDKEILFMLDGHKPLNFKLKNSLDGAVAGNIIAGGVVGGIVDGISGRGGGYQESVQVVLAPIGSKQESRVVEIDVKAVAAPPAAPEVEPAKQSPSGTQGSTPGKVTTPPAEATNAPLPDPPQAPEAVNRQHDDAIPSLEHPEPPVKRAEAASAALSPTAPPARSLTVACKDLEQGSGRVAEQGDEVEYRYTCRLADGTLIFDSDAADGKTRRRAAGSTGKPTGLGTALIGTRPGMRRVATVPPEFAYGSRGNAKSKIPPDATLIFEIRVVEVHDPPMP